MVRRSQFAPINRRVSDATSIPAPVGGLNALDSLAEMQPTQCVNVSNFYPKQYGMQIRRGWRRYATGISGNVETLFNYSAVDGTEKMFGIAEGVLYDVSTAGPVGAPVLTGFANSRWQHRQMTNIFGTFLNMVNGADTPQTFNGTAWADLALVPDTGETLDIKDLIHVTVAHRRFWYVEKDSGNAWYGGIDEVSGALKRFGVGELFSLGGFLMAIGTWSNDSGSGMQEQTIFVSSNGEVVVYAGFDPDTADGFTLAGVYKCGSPVTRRCLTRYGSDLLILCEDGVLPLTSILSQSRVLMAVALSNIIQQRLSNDVTLYRERFGWEMLLVPRHQFLYVNVPDPVESRQFVMNTVTNAWTIFNGYAAFVWETFKEEPFFGAAGYVGQAWYGNLDDYDEENMTGNKIPAFCLQSFSYFGAPSQQKHWTMVRPVFNAGGPPTVAAYMNVDFEVWDNTPALAGSSVTEDVSLWDVAVWDGAFWSAATQPFKTWFGLNDVGFAGAVFLKTLTAAETYWITTELVWEVGGLL